MKVLNDEGLAHLWDKIKNTFVPNTLTINNKPLTSDINIEPEDITNLNTWITSNRDTVDGLLSKDDAEKIKNISESQENKIEVINVNNSPLIITNKTVNIPLASNDTAGVVKTSNNENKISLDEEGVMEVNDINVNKLVQTSGDILILDCSDEKGE